MKEQHFAARSVLLFSRIKDITLFMEQANFDTLALQAFNSGMPGFNLFGFEALPYTIEFFLLLLHIIGGNTFMILSLF